METDLDELRALTRRGDGRDRAFVDAVIRMRWARTSDPSARAELDALHRELREASLRSHDSLRGRIASGAVGGDALRAQFDEVPAFERDHFVEEVLGIAYPPLEEPAPESELIAYAPSGYDDIVYAFDATRLGPGDRFLDIGSGAGKAVLLAALLRGAASAGIERDGSLDALAAGAARELAVRGARFDRGDARDVVFDAVDVVFMYLPFTGSALAAVMERLLEAGGRNAPRPRGRFLCAGALDLHRYPELAEAAPSKSWLHVYAWR